GLFGIMGIIYLLLFICNLVFGPYIISYLLQLPSFFFIIGYLLFSLLVATIIVRLLSSMSNRKRLIIGGVGFCFLFVGAFMFFPKEKILEKASLTRYRIDVMTMPADKVIEKAYAEGKTYEPVIRAAQNQ